MLDNYGYTMDDIYIARGYEYMIPLLDMSQEEEIMLALAMAERAVSAAELREDTIANFEISDQAVRWQGARMVLSSME